jgi:hypothetical protein
MLNCVKNTVNLLNPAITTGNTCNTILPCLRINVALNSSTSDVYMTIMNYPPNCRSGIIKSVSLVEYIDNNTDIIHIVLDPIYIYPTWTGH